MAQLIIGLGSACIIASIVALFLVKGRDGLILAIALLAATIFQLGMYARFVTGNSIYYTITETQRESLEALNSSLESSADAVQKLVGVIDGLARIDRDASSGLTASAKAELQKAFMQIDADLKASKQSLEKVRDENGRTRAILLPGGVL
jgi:cytochrome bd-type quinol oxidase subunit 1